MAASNLTLVLPPLSFSELEREQLLHDMQLAGQSIDTLRRFLSRGSQEFIAHQMLALCDVFGLPVESIEKLPFATLLASGNGFDSTTGYWLIAEPVHLKPDLDHVLLFDFPPDAIMRYELAQLVEELQPLLEEMGLVMHTGHDCRIYIRTVDIPAVTFTQLNDVKGRNILPFLPEGSDASKWRLLMNEVQMMLTQSRVNQQREEVEKPTVNGMWFWGGGFMLPKRYAQRFDLVMTAEPFARGLANFTATRLEPVGNDFSSIDPSSSTMISFSASKTAGEVMNCLVELDENWLVPAMQALKKDRLQSLVLLVGNRKITMQRKQLGRFWKRRIGNNAIIEALQ